MKDTKDPKCGNCSHFLQHYARSDTGYHYVHCGHCLKKISQKSIMEKLNQIANLASYGSQWRYKSQKEEMKSREDYFKWLTKLKKCTLY